MGRSYGSWRYLIIASIVAIALAVALVVTNAGNAGPAGGSTTKTDTGPAKTLQVGGDGPARFHPLPS